MKQILLLQSENESLRIKDFLEENNIPFVIKSFRDPVYSSVFQTQKGWGILEAPEEYEEEILRFYQQAIPVLEEPASYVSPESKKVRNYYVYSTLVLFVVSLLLGWLYYKKDKECKEYLNAGITNSEWDKQGENLIAKWKSNNNLAFINTDANYDLIFETITGYDTSGNFISRYYDVNENGITDKTSYYDKTKYHNITEEFVDQNEDALHDLQNIFLPDEYILSLLDEDFDGKYEKVEIHGKGNAVVKTYTMEEFLQKVK